MFNYAISEVNMNAGGLYWLFAIVVLFALGQSIFYLIRSLKQANKLGIDKEKIKKVVTSSISFTILPALGIFIGIITLIPLLGIPIPAIRLSIVGALQYETLAASNVAEAMAGSMESLIGNMTGEQFVTIVMAMSFGIIFGPLFCLVALKKLRPKMQNMANKSGGKWKDIMFSCVFVGMVAGFIGVSIYTAASAPKDITSYYSVIAVVVAALSMWGFDFLVKKYKQNWLENFSLAFSMVLGMGVVALISYLHLKNAPADVNAVSETVRLALTALGI